MDQLTDAVREELALTPHMQRLAQQVVPMSAPHVPCELDARLASKDSFRATAARLEQRIAALQARLAGIRRNDAERR